MKLRLHPKWSRWGQNLKWIHFGIKTHNRNQCHGDLDLQSCQHNDMFTPEIMDVHLTLIGFAGIFSANFPKHHFYRERVERCLELEGHDSCNPEKIHIRYKTNHIWSTSFSTIWEISIQYQKNIILKPQASSLISLSKPIYIHPR